MSIFRIRGVGATRALLALAVVLFFAGPTRAPAAITYYANQYHAQVTNYFCGAAAMEMMLDTPATTNPLSLSYNQNVVNLLAAGDGLTVPGNPFPRAPNNGSQTAIYSLVHGGAYGAGNLYGVNSVYNQPAYGPGTDPVGFAKGLNAIDNPLDANNANVTNWSGNLGPNTGNHVYNAIGGTTFPPNLASAANASNTLAKALIDFGVPASVSINNGGHWIDVNGVATTTVGGTTYINGFYIRDPWTGYAQAQGQANRGLGKNTYLRYGYDNRPLGGNRIGGWFNYFTPASTSANGGLGNGYMIEVEPIGPELPDFDNDFSIPVAPIEGAVVDAATARADAIADLGNTANLNSEAGFESGGFDPNMADEMFLQMPGDTAGEGDWLVPYEGAAGNTNDITGFLLIDATTGVIDQATWLDPTDTPMTLSDIDQMFLSESLGNADPFDNFAPEPSSWVMMMLGVGGVGLFAVRRRRTTVAA